MVRSRRIYAWLGAVAAASLMAVALLPYGGVIQTVAAIPLVASLTAAIFQLVRDEASHDRQVQRDEASHERQLLLVDAHNRFALAASSHLASIAFDKHVAFCESYVAEVLATLGMLFREGPTEQVLRHAANLYRIRDEHALWLTPSIEGNLEKFEAALRSIGAADHYVRVAHPGEGRQKQLNEMYKTFADVLGSKHMGPAWQGEPLTEDLAVSKVIHGLRGALGIEELSEMRTAIIKNALSSLKDEAGPSG